MDDIEHNRNSMMKNFHKTSINHDEGQLNAISLVTGNRQCVTYSLGVGRGVTKNTVEKQLVTKCYTGPLPDSCEDGNEPSGSIKGREFLD
jgi:hypothetical protein